MAPVKPVELASQAGDEQQMHKKVPRNLSDFSKLWNKNHYWGIRPSEAFCHNRPKLPTSNHACEVVLCVQ
jgi:hypothetical protein